ncbi:MAG: glycosyltransferase family 2 protein [Bacteroidales bacterium]|jgi:cellulose synthase/poly-beta-1,6-N-acetylglucosamine synthase-like glycosyltransferase|nr:glycosyltransferase family 2 protein [Bacteroidales bacterium]
MIYVAVVFWICLSVVFYTYAGYGLLVFVLVKIKEKCGKRKRRSIPSASDMPAMTLVIAAYNELPYLEEKISNCMELRYPYGKLKILWVTDGTDDGSEKRLSDIAADNADSRANGAKIPEIKAIHQPDRRGKTAALNRALKYVDTPLVVFSDANAMLCSEALAEIAAEFADERVGCVSGEKRVSSEAGAAGDAAGTEGLYWKYESFLKDMDYRLYSAVGAAGELFAARTSLLEPLPEDTLLDDFMMSMRIAMKGYKIAYCRNACAVEGNSANMFEEGKRKVRIAAGGLQSIARLSPLLNIFKYGMLSFQYISHRVLRWSVTPACLPVMFIANAILAFCGHSSGFSGVSVKIYFWLFICQVAFYICALAGAVCSRAGKKNKILYAAYYFLFMNYNVMRAFFYSGNKGGVWKKSGRAR